MLQTRTIEPATLGLLKRLMLQPYLDAFFLVGGTALALQLGHRFSIDLDLFTNDAEFDQDELLFNLKKDFQVSVQHASASIFQTNINGVKVDFVRVRYPKLFPMHHVEGVRMLDMRDIAPMKLSAMSQRGSKKDFYDIHFLLKKMPLTDMLTLYLQKFDSGTVFHVVKSLTYFDDAEKAADPIVFDKKVTWQKVKSSMLKAVQDLG